MTTSGIGYSLSWIEKADGKIPVLSIGAYFFPEKSWIQEGYCTPEILAHERLHFDITELFAREMRKRAARANIGKDIQGAVQRIYAQVVKEMGAMQRAYDHQTDYSRNVPMQAQWYDRITTALQMPKP